MPKGNSGIKRGGSGAQVKAGEQAQKQMETQKQARYGGEGKTTETVDVQINASAPGAIEQLREMSARGEVPISVIGSRDDRARFLKNLTVCMQSRPES